MENKKVIIGIVIIVCIICVILFYRLPYSSIILFNSDVVIEIDWSSGGNIGSSKGTTIIKSDGLIYIDETIHTMYWGGIEETEDKKFYSDKKVSNEDLSLMKIYASLITNNDCKEHPEKIEGTYTYDSWKNSTIYLYNNIGKFKLFDSKTINTSIFANNLLEIIDKYYSIYFFSNKKWTAE